MLTYMSENSHIYINTQWSCSGVSNSLQSHELYSPWDSQGQNIGVGSLSLLLGIFPTQGSNPGLLHCRRILYQLSHNGSPYKHIYIIQMYGEYKLQDSVTKRVEESSQRGQMLALSCMHWTLFYFSHLFLLVGG